MSRIFFALPCNDVLTSSLAVYCKAELGAAIFHHFPDGETLVKVDSDVNNKIVILVCTLDRPDGKLLSLYFLAQTAKELGAQHICLVAPYLAYMRQDKRFSPGEGITSIYFSKLVSHFIDSIITVDPHLHRIHALSEIYSIPATVIHATQLISDWIKANIKTPVLIGPDEESTQWVSAVANGANVPYIILQKIRKGDTDVEVSVPHLEKYIHHTPVLVDDIISTGRTMISTIVQLKNAGMSKPVCIGVHGLFTGNAHSDLLHAGINEVVTCNTIIHQTNKISIDKILGDGILQTIH